MYARVDGNITATRKHKSLTGWRLLICQPLDAKGDPAGAPTVAIDPYGAGLHERVIVSTDGAASRRNGRRPLESGSQHDHRDR